MDWGSFKVGIGVHQPLGALYILCSTVRPPPPRPHLFGSGTRAGSLGLGSETQENASGAFWFSLKKPPKKGDQKTTYMGPQENLPLFLVILGF